MKTVLIYKSNTGFTKKYAEWIAKALSADIFEVKDINADKLAPYDAVIYGGSLHASCIIGVKFIKRNLDKLKDKKVVVFTTGVLPVREETICEVRDKTLLPNSKSILNSFI